MPLLNYFRKPTPSQPSAVTELRRELILLLNRMNVGTGYIHELDIMNPVGPIDTSEEMMSSMTKTISKKATMPTSNVQHHPTYLTMIKRAILALNDTKGASKAAILKYIAQNYQLGENLPVINTHIRNALKRGLDSGDVKQVKGHGASGSFTVAPAHNMKKKDIKAKKAVTMSAKPKSKSVKEVKEKKKPVKKTVVKKVTKKAAKEKEIAKKIIPKLSKKKTTIHKKTKKVSKKPKAKMTKKAAKTAKKV